MLIAAIAALQLPRAAAQEALAVVVSASRPIEAVDAQTLALMFMRKKERWPDGRRVQPVNLPADDPLRHQFSMAVLQQTPAGLDDYWNEQYFHGVLPPHVVRSQAAMARFVAATEGAIGYLRYCGLPDGLRVVLIVGASGRLHTADEASPACPPPAAAQPASR
jgi:ABC-type phosphate transport system substrate-binding protein